METATLMERINPYRKLLFRENIVDQKLKRNNEDTTLE